MCVCVCEVLAPAEDIYASVVPTSPYVAVLDPVIIKQWSKLMGNPDGKILMIFIINFSF